MSYKSIIHLLIFFHFANPAAVASKQNIAAVMTVSDEICSVTISLYRALVQEVSLHDSLTLAPQGEVREVLQATSDLQRLSSLPVVNRQDLNLGEQQQGLEGYSASLQAMLDTLVLDAALIVDCQASTNGLAKSCGLYYYERRRGKITAAATKAFDAGIRDASNWAAIFVSELIVGKKMHGQKVERMRLMQTLSEVHPVPQQASYFAEGQFNMQRWQGGSFEEVDRVPGWGVSLGKQRDHFKYYLSYQDSRTAQHSEHWVSTNRFRAFSAGIGVEMPALERLFWSLRLEAGYAERLLRVKDQLSRQASAQSLRSAYEVGVGWYVHGSNQFSVNISRQDFQDFKHTRLEGGQLPYASHSISLRVGARI